MNEMCEVDIRKFVVLFFKIQWCYLCTVTANTVVNNMFRNYFERFAEKTRPHKISWCSLKPNLKKNCSQKFRSVSAEPLAATRGTLRFHGTTFEKHCIKCMSFISSP